jgi:[ribosomal protein S18]-alanine N-acetyltransferase
VAFDVRDFRREDFATLYQIDQVCFPQGIAYTRFELAFYMRRREAFTLVATAEQRKASSKSRPPVAEVAGFIVAESTKKVGHIITIDVLPKFRRHGLGSLLLNAAEKRLRESGSQEVKLETAADNASAQAFYQHHGYVQINELPGYYANGVDALVLKKNLLTRGEAANVPT